MRISSTLAFMSLLAVLATSCASSRKKSAETDSSIIEGGVKIDTGNIDEVKRQKTDDSGAIEVGLFDTGVMDRDIGDVDIDDVKEIVDEKTDDVPDVTISPCVSNCPYLEWVTIPGGVFVTMDYYDTLKQREVTVPGFSILKTKVTVSQFNMCVDAGVCHIAGNGMNDYYCNSLSPDRDDYPINCITWENAKKFAQWVDGRLPSEAEWEYAMRGGGQDIKYPWGDEEVSCEYAVIADGMQYGCGTLSTMEVCSKPLGNTAQGLCDMIGGLLEYMEDVYHRSYEGAPTDGSAWVDDPDPYSILYYPEQKAGHVLRGCFYGGPARYCLSNAYYPTAPPEADELDRYGFRVVQDLD